MSIAELDLLSTAESAGAPGLRDRLGATANPDGSTSFLVWAPRTTTCQLHIVSPLDRLIPMEPVAGGYFTVRVDGCEPGAHYFYRLDGGQERPDPASRFQPLGVHGPSAVCPTHSPRYAGPALPMRDYVIYELHIGTFTPEGTFDAAIPHLDRLRDLGVTAIEIMPVAEFPGGRNWGYDGVQVFAASKAYGGPEGLRRLVDACRERGLAAILDVVYNHLGPEGNYLNEFGPYFDSRHQTGWGDAVNFDGPESDAVRRFFIENALYWTVEIGFDALRLDAVHAIYDRSAYPFLQELADRLRDVGLAHGLDIRVIAESDMNDARLLMPRAWGGFGIDAQWADDLHHALHTVLTGEQSGYYADYGSVEDIVTALREGWIYSGQYSKVRRRRFGNSPTSLQPAQLIVCTQNHDQVGNRMRGERLVHLAGEEAARVAAACVILSPYTPMLFMGEEYAEPAPFFYFVSHGDLALQEAVRCGRRAEFAEFARLAEPPDPQSECTFLDSKLNQQLVAEGRHARMHAWYKRLLQLRREHPAMQGRSRRDFQIAIDGELVIMRRRGGDRELAVLLHFGREPRSYPVDFSSSEWTCVLDSHAQEWSGHEDLCGFPTLSGLQCVVWER